MLVHLKGPLPPTGFESLELRVPEACIGQRILADELKELCPDWRSYPPHLLLQEISFEWITNSKSVAMEVPSAVSPRESNYLLNPTHADFSKIQTVRTDPLLWDSRLIELSMGL
jgi:RES domain-containing protein